MALFPKIQSPCPYKADLAAVMDGDMCRMCKRQVHDLTAMDDSERVAFFESCSGAEVCVSYRVPLAAAAIAAAAMMIPVSAVACDATGQETVIVGGVKNTTHVAYVQADPADRAAPALPVVYEDAPAPKSAGMVKSTAPAAP